jgi:hypothetical protein
MLCSYSILSNLMQNNSLEKEANMPTYNMLEKIYNIWLQ